MKSIAHILVGCDVIDSRGEISFSVNSSICAADANQNVVYLDGRELVQTANGRESKWRRPIGRLANQDVSRADDLWVFPGGTYLVGATRHVVDEIEIFYPWIVRFDSQTGQELGEFDSFKSMSEIIRLNPNHALYEFDDFGEFRLRPETIGKRLISFFRIQSLFEVPANKNSPIHPAFEAGNLVFTIQNRNSVFILGKSLQEVLATFSPFGRSAAILDLRLNPMGVFDLLAIQTDKLERSYVTWNPETNLVHEIRKLNPTEIPFYFRGGLTFSPSVSLVTDVSGSSTLVVASGPGEPVFPAISIRPVKPLKSDKIAILD